MKMEFFFLTTAVLDSLFQNKIKNFMTYSQTKPDGLN